MNAKKREYLKSILGKIIERFVAHNAQFEGINFEGCVDYDEIGETLEEVSGCSRGAGQVPDIKKFSERILHGMNNGEYFTQKGKEILFRVQIEKSPNLLERIKESVGREESFFYHIGAIARDAEGLIRDGRGIAAEEHLKELKKLGFYDVAVKYLKKRKEYAGGLLNVSPEGFEHKFDRGLAYVAAAVLVVSIPVFLFSFSPIIGLVAGNYETISLLKIGSAIGVVLGLTMLVLSKLGVTK